VLATFDGPARAIRCVGAIQHGVATLGLHVRAGLHTGEIELLGDDVGGIAVAIAARLTSLAGSDEVVVSSTVKDLVAGRLSVSRIGGSTPLKACPRSGTSSRSSRHDFQQDQALAGRDQHPDEQEQDGH
jgi:class 3 adenylate cyclase